MLSGPSLLKQKDYVSDGDSSRDGAFIAYTRITQRILDWALCQCSSIFCFHDAHWYGPQKSDSRNQSTLLKICELVKRLWPTWIIVNGEHHACPPPPHVLQNEWGKHLKSFCLTRQTTVAKQPTVRGNRSTKRSDGNLTFQRDQPVHIAGLQGRPALNKRVSRLVRYDAGKGRWHVQLDGCVC